MGERNIMDNVFTFWEATTVVVKTKQNLVVLLLDFEKALSSCLSAPDRCLSRVGNIGVLECEKEEFEVSLVKE